MTSTMKLANLGFNDLTSNLDYRFYRNVAFACRDWLESLDYSTVLNMTRSTSSTVYNTQYCTNRDRTLHSIPGIHYSLYNCN